jgi:hypothetical protein
LIGEVSWEQKRRRDVGLFVFISSMKRGQDYIRMKSLIGLIVAKVFEVAWERGRIQFDEISPDPTVRHTIWTQVNIAPHSKRKSCETVPCYIVHVEKKKSLTGSPDIYFTTYIQLFSLVSVYEP